MNPTALLDSPAFLMAAFITATSAMALRLVTAVVGLATVVVTMPAIVAAARNIEVQQQVYMRHISSEQRCYQLHRHTEATRMNVMMMMITASVMMQITVIA